MPQLSRCTPFGRDLTRRTFCSFLTLTLVGPASPAQAEEPADAAPASQEPGRAPSAKDLYAQRRYVAAAHAFEAMDTTGALYNAGMARAAAGHHAHALLRWARYQELTVDLTESGRADIVRLMGEARQRTVSVHFAATAAPDARTLVVQPPNSLAVDALLVPWPANQETVTVYLDVGTWSAALRTAEGTSPAHTVSVHEGETELAVKLTPTLHSSPVRLRIGPRRAIKRGIDVTWTGPGRPEQRQFVAQDTRWELPPGKWQFHARARGYEAVDRAVAVTEGPTQVDLTLRRDRHEQARVGLGVGLGLAGLGLLVSGGVLFAIGRRIDEKAATALDGVPNPSTDDSIDVVERDLRRQSGGVALLSTGGGATVVALTAGLGGDERVLAAEAGVGAVFLAGGIAWLVHAQGCPARLPESQDRPLNEYAPTYDELRGCAAQGVPGAVLLGTGAGLLGSAIVALATRRTLRRNPSRIGASAKLSTTDWAVSIQGKF